MAFSVILDTASSTKMEAGQQMEPTEKTAPPLAVVCSTISAPPSSGLSPLANRRVLAGDWGEILSVSWPEAPPGMR